jgi:hypothetical protein
VNSTVSDVPGATTVSVATLIGAWKVRLCGTEARFSKVTRTSAPAWTVSSAGSNFSSVPVSVPIVIWTPSPDGALLVGPEAVGDELAFGGAVAGVEEGLVPPPHALMARMAATSTLR